MNARFRIGSTYHFKKTGRFYIAEVPLVYIGYKNKEFVFKSKPSHGCFHQYIGKEALSEVEVTTEWDKW